MYSLGNGSGTNFTKGAVAIGVASIGSGGTTGFSLTIVDQNDNLYSAGSVTINFSSPCIAAGTSKILALGSTTAVTSLSTTTGSVSGTYVAAGCGAPDTITATATVAGQMITATGIVTVAPASAGSIQFVSATPTTIGLKGTGLNETSTVIFKVTDATGAAVSGASVAFTTDTTVGGLRVSPSPALSAADGTVQTVVSSGTVHTVVRVNANIAATASTAALSTESSQLTVTTGLPASSAFSIAVGKPSYSSSVAACSNVETYTTDGVTVPLVVFLADRYNNPVPDGTAVSFTTNGGHIDGSCLTGVAPATPGEGSCSVNWTSANPRPTTSDTPPVLANGRATILATAVGEESFTDLYGTGYYESTAATNYPNGDPFAHIGEPYINADESPNGYIVGDYFLDYNSNHTYDPAGNTYIGLTCSGGSATAPLTCDPATPGVSELAISATHLVIMSTSSAHISLQQAGGSFSNSGTLANPSLSIPVSTAAVAGTPGSPAVTYTGSISFNVQDSNGNSMAAGTVITTTVTIGSVAQTPASFTVACNSDIGGQDLAAVFTAPTTAGGGTMTISVVSPSGTTTLFAIPITVN